MLDDIRGNIIHIINSTQSRRTRINNRHHRYNYNNNNYNNHNNHNNYNNHNNNNNYNNHRHHRHRHSNRPNQYFNGRQHNSIFYDYNNPINPVIYTHFNPNSNNNNNDNPNNNNPNNNNNNNPNSRFNIFTAQNNEALANVLQNFLNTTEIVRPTNEQIQNASRIIRYGDIENPLSQSCPISLDEFQENHMVKQLLYCGHLFHQTHFDQWFQNNVKCPVCRYDIRNYRPLPRTDFENSNTINTSVINHDTNEPETNQTETISNNTEINSSFVTSNQIEHVTFDITNEEFTDMFLDRLIRDIFQPTLNSNTRNNTNNTNNNTNNNRFINSSNNIL
jgi:hypothetical protein